MPEEETMRLRRTTALGCLICLLAACASAGEAPPGTAAIDASDHPSLQAAFDALPPAGGIVHIPPGQYPLTEPIVLTRPNTRVEGAGTATHLVNRNEEGKPALIVRPPDRATNRRSRVWRVQLAHVRISGNPKSGDGVLAEGVNELFVHGLAVDHNGGHGLNLVDCYEDPRVADCIVTYNAKAGLNLLGCHDIVVSANQFEENQDGVRCLDGYNLCMTGNCLDDHLRHGVVIENTYGSVVSGNMIEECRGTAIVLDRDCYGIALSSNVIAHNGTGVDLRDAWGCAVSANTFTINTARGLAIGPKSGRTAVTGNTFCNTYIGDGRLRRTKPGQDAAAGIVLEGTADITVSANVFSGLAGSAVRADKACRRLLLTGNVLTDLGREKPGAAPPVDLGEADAQMQNNLINPQNHTQPEERRND
jgi:hypothetical protein